MFKFARYFFVVFLITTIIPLLLLFFWNHHQMEKMRKEKDQHFMSIATKQLEYSNQQYLKTREALILWTIQNIPHNKMSLERLQKTFHEGKVELLYGKNINKMSSYYEIMSNNPSNKPALFITSVIPFNDSEIKGIKVSKKADLEQLHPIGPFNLEIYKGDKIDKNNLIEIIHDPFSPPHPEFPPPIGFSPHPKPDFNNHHNFAHNPAFPPPSPDSHEAPCFHKQDNKKAPESSTDMPIFSVIKLKDNNGKNIVTMVIKPVKFPKFFGPGNPAENQFGLVILFTGFLLSLIIGFYINKNFINPLLLLSQASVKVQKGDLSFKINTDTKEEQILNTFNNFNEMIKGLQEKEELRKNFITNLTHDLRTPLIAQERALELISIEFERLSIKDAYELAKGVEKNNKHLLRMVNLILESYRFDSEHFNLIISDINVSELIDNCFEKLKPLANEKNIQFLNLIPRDFPSISGDITSLKRVFLNLISNAIENISENDRIEVNAQKNDKSIKISVQDNGPGIAEEDLKYIFDRYYTGKSDERKIGSGLGLYVCKKLIEMHKGKIWVETEKDSFTRFIVELPISS